MRGRPPVRFDRRSDLPGSGFGQSRTGEAPSPFECGILALPTGLDATLLGLSVPLAVLGARCCGASGGSASSGSSARTPSSSSACTTDAAASAFSKSSSRSSSFAETVANNGSRGSTASVLPSPAGLLGSASAGSSCSSASHNTGLASAASATAAATGKRPSLIPRLPSISAPRPTRDPAAAAAAAAKRAQACAAAADGAGFGGAMRACVAAGWYERMHPATAAAVAADINAAEADQASRVATSLQQPAGRHALLLPPAFPGTQPSVFFPGSLAAALPSWAATSSVLWLHHARVMVKYAGGGGTSKPAKQVFRQAGFKVTKGDGWTVLWGRPADILVEETLRALGPFQRINHFPGTWELGRKDRLYRSLAVAKRSKGATFDVVPKFFLMPTDAGALEAEVARSPEAAFIMKPVASSRGRGVRVVGAAAALEAARGAAGAGECLLQRYIADPFLIAGYKFDLRIYVAVTSLDPLRVYVHTEGLVRFAGRRYSSNSSTYRQRRRHLTNYSVNKCKGGSGGSPKPRRSSGSGGDGVGGGNAEETGGGPGGCLKWSLSALAGYLEQQGHSWDAVWAQVKGLAAVALIAAEPRITAAARPVLRHRNSCFELFGMDVLLDSSLKAWLLEINTTPSMSADSPLDMQVKETVLADLMSLVGVVPWDPAALEKHEVAEKQARLMGRPPAAGAPPSTPPPLRQAAAASQAAVAARNPAAAKAAELVVRTVQEAEAIDFERMPAVRLPLVVRETIAEHRRRGGFQRVFPCPEEPERYLYLFEIPRVSNFLVARVAAGVASRLLRSSFSGGSGGDVAV